MTIPLKTYDPNWEARWKSIHSYLEREQKKAYEDRDHDLANALLTKLHEAFHAQFKTTGDYAAWSENNVSIMAKSNGLDDYKISTFPVDGSVESTQKLVRIHHERIQKLSSMERRQRPMDYPSNGEPFSYELNDGEVRFSDMVSMDYQVPVFNNNELEGTKTEVSTYNFIIEKKKTHANICFLQFGEDGPSSMSVIEQLASFVYTVHCGFEAVIRGEPFYRPEDINFYLYLPPTTNKEGLTKVGLSWSADNQEFYCPQWNNLETVPYLIRKIAAAEGVAKDPDAPGSPGRTGAISGPRIAPKG